MFRIILIFTIMTMLSACVSFSDSIAQRASEVATTAAIRATRDSDTNRRLHLTMVGGQRLNIGLGASPKPVLACIYVVANADWFPPLQGAVGDCASKDKDSALIAATSKSLAPNQIVQLEMPISAQSLWLVIDADYSNRPSNYSPLRLPVEGKGLVHLAAWLDSSYVYDGRQLLPVVSTGSEPVNQESLSSAVRPREEQGLAKRQTSEVKPVLRRVNPKPSSSKQ